MTYDENGTEYLYTTALPVLLDGKRTAGYVAMDMYTRHGVNPHWFGRGFSFSLAVYAQRHPLPAPLSALSDEILTQILLDFASEHVGLLALYPCSPEAEAFVARVAPSLESRYVILPLPVDSDPLAPLVRKA